MLVVQAPVSHISSLHEKRFTTSPIYIAAHSVYGILVVVLRFIVCLELHSTGAVYFDHFAIHPPFCPPFAHATINLGASHAHGRRLYTLFCSRADSYVAHAECEKIYRMGVTCCVCVCVESANYSPWLRCSPHRHRSLASRVYSLVYITYSVQTPHDHIIQHKYRSRLPTTQTPTVCAARIQYQYVFAKGLDVMSALVAIPPPLPPVLIAF